MEIVLLELICEMSKNQLVNGESQDILVGIWFAFEIFYCIFFPFIVVAAFFFRCNLINKHIDKKVMT